ncbi:hypothetical protein AKJ16_DCAP27504 [Drosera capensis]
MNLNKIIYVTRKKRCEVNVDSSAEKSLDSWTALQDSKPWMDFRSLPDEVKMSTVTVRFSLLNFYFNPSSRPTKRTILCWNQYNDSYLRLHSNLRVRLFEKAEEANLEVIQCSQSLAFLEFRNYSGEYQTWEDREFDESRFFEGTDWGSPLLLDLKKKLFMNLNKIIYVTRKKRCEVNVDSSAEKSLDSWTALQDSKPWMDFRSLPDEVKMSTVTVRLMLKLWWGQSSCLIE